MKSNKIKKILDKYEQTSPVYKAWVRWLNLSEKQKKKELEKWDKYYQKCRNSFWGKAFFNKKFYVKKKKTVFIKKPKGIDPIELLITIQPYYNLKRKLYGR